MIPAFFTLKGHRPKFQQNLFFQLIIPVNKSWRYTEPTK